MISLNRISKTDYFLTFSYEWTAKTGISRTSGHFSVMRFFSALSVHNFEIIAISTHSDLERIMFRREYVSSLFVLGCCSTIATTEYIHGLGLLSSTMMLYLLTNRTTRPLIDLDIALCRFLSKGSAN